MDIFCETHSDCQDSITTIAEILSNNSPSTSYEYIMEQFLSLEIKKVCDLASTTKGKAAQINLNCSDSLAKLYQAFQIYDQKRLDQLNNAKIEYQQGNFVKAQEISKNLYDLKPDINSLMLLGASYLKNENLDLAMNCFIVASEMNPNCATISMNLGAIYFNKSQFKEANQCYYNAVTQKIGFFDAIIHLAITLFKIDNIKGAVDVCEDLLNFEPELFSVRSNYGKYLLCFNKIKEAKQQLKTVIKDEPSYTDAWNNLGDVYFAAGKLEKAISHYEKALELNNNFPSAWINLGLAYSRKNEYEKAIIMIKRALELRPGDVCALNNLAIIYYEQKNIKLCMETYKKLLEFQPESLDIYLDLGLIYFNDEKNYHEAEKYFRKCMELNPEEKQIYKYLSATYQFLGKNKTASEISVSLGDLYFNQSDQENACDAYMYAIYLDPENADGHWKLGLILFRMGRYDLAYLRYRNSIELRPDFPDVYCDIASVYLKKNLLERALVYYKTALKFDPKHKIALDNMVYVQHKLGLFDDVIKHYTTNCKDDDAEGFFELANILYKDLGKFDEALFYYEKVLNIKNGACLDTYLNMGKVLRELKRNNDAINCFLKAIEIQPECANPYVYLGSIYKENEDFNKAILFYESALKIKPDHSDAYCNLVHCWRQVCNWTDYDFHLTKLKSTICKQLELNCVPSLLPQDSLIYPFTPEILKNIASKYAEQCVKKSHITKNPPQTYEYQTTLSSNRCIRVGYVSLNYGDRPTSQLIQSILKFHDKNKIEVFCYSLSGNDNSPSCFRLQTSDELDNFRDISNMSMIDAANQINQDGIHLLINMNGYTLGARNEIFALRPAPIQVLWHGYPGTSGSTFIDYIITDKVCSPPEHEHFYTEKLAYMNQSVFIDNHNEKFDLVPCINDNCSGLDAIENEPSIPSLNKPILDKEMHSNGTSSNNLSMYSFRILKDNSIKWFDRQLYNIPDDAIVYCNFSRLHKIDPFTLNMWASILNNVPNSILWLLRFPSLGEDNLRKFASEQNIDLSRIIFSDFVPKEDHIRRLQLADVFLDTPLYNGHTTCLDAIWAGLPIVTLPKESLASRAAASQLTTLGFTDTIATNEQDYIQIATNLGLHKNILAKIKLKLWALRTDSKLFDCKLYAEELERMYKNMWNNFLAENNK